MSCMCCSCTTKGCTCSFFQAPAWFSSLCIFSLKSAARNASITNLQLAHSEEHHPQVEKLLTCLLTDLSAEERRIRRGRCTLESVLVCPCIEVLPVSESDCAMLGLVVMARLLLQCTVCSIGMFEFSSCFSCYIPPPQATLQVTPVLVPPLSPWSQLAKIARSVLLIYHLSTSTQSRTQTAFSKWLSPFRKTSQKLSPHS